jgi:hypothetical protein
MPVFHLSEDVEYHNGGKNSVADNFLAFGIQLSPVEWRVTPTFYVSEVAEYHNGMNPAPFRLSQNTLRPYF